MRPQMAATISANMSKLSPQALSLQQDCLAANWYVFLRRVKILTFYLTDMWVKCHITIWKLIYSMLFTIFCLRSKLTQYTNTEEAKKHKQKCNLKGCFNKCLKSHWQLVFSDVKTKLLFLFPKNDSKMAIFLSVWDPPIHYPLISKGSQLHGGF